MKKYFLPLNSLNVEAVAKIDSLCFSSEKWSLELFKAEINDKMKHYVVYYINNNIIGFGGYSQVLDEGHIMNIAVLPEYRQNGYGKEILSKLINNGRENGINAFTLEVRVSNNVARLLYERAGFSCVGVRKKYYPDKEDACIYWLYI